MMLRWKWFLKEMRVARRYEKNFRTGVEIIKKRKEIHENYLIANRTQNKETEAKWRGWLEAIAWLVQEVK